jgi:hypothetical protein
MNVCGVLQVCEGSGSSYGAAVYVTKDSTERHDTNIWQRQHSNVLSRCFATVNNGSRSHSVCVQGLDRGEEGRRVKAGCRRPQHSTRQCDGEESNNSATEKHSPYHSTLTALPRSLEMHTRSPAAGVGHVPMWPPCLGRSVEPYATTTNQPTNQPTHGWQRLFSHRHTSELPQEARMEYTVAHATETP